MFNGLPLRIFGNEPFYYLAIQHGLKLQKKIYSQGFLLHPYAAGIT
ncbi:hypothetical protein BO1005MUT1_180124 [Hyphomicrobiales bacterium]|nr:hypothetical protein BO1005MUT1_180124 [Hyphomicrobiales bacterium]